MITLRYVGSQDYRARAKNTNIGRRWKEKTIFPILANNIIDLNI